MLRSDLAGGNHNRYGAPSTAVTMPTGSSVGAKTAGHEIGDDREQRADQRRRDDADARRAHQAAGDRRCHEGDEGDRPGRGRGRSPPGRRHQHERQPGAPDPDTERGRGVGAELEQAQLRPSTSVSGISTSERDADRAARAPSCGR